MFFLKKLSLVVGSGANFLLFFYGGPKGTKREAEGGSLICHGRKFSKIIKAIAA